MKKKKEENIPQIIIIHLYAKNTTQHSSSSVYEPWIIQKYENSNELLKAGWIPNMKDILLRNQHTAATRMLERHFAQVLTLPPCCQDRKVTCSSHWGITCNKSCLSSSLSTGTVSRISCICSSSWAPEGRNRPIRDKRRGDRGSITQAERQRWPIIVKWE